MSEGQQKLVASLYLDYEKLKNDVTAVNDLLKSIGVGFDADSIAKRVRVEFDKISKELATNLQKVGTQVSRSTATTAGNVVGEVMRQTMTSINGEVQSYSTTFRRNNRVFRLTENADRTRQTVTEDMTGSINRANELYTRQKQIVSEIHQLRMRSIGAKDGELDEINNRTAALQREQSANQGVIDSIDARYRNRLKELELTRQQQKSDSAYRQAESKSRQTAEDKRNLTEINTLYKDQNKILDEIGKLQVRAPKAGANEKEVIRDRVAALQDEYEANQRSIDAYDEKYKSAVKQTQLNDKIVKNASDMEQAEERHNDQLREKQSRLDTVLRTTLAIMTVMATRVLRQAWKDATEYVTQYYDKMNEIRIVTGMTEEQADRLGQAYRNMGRDMSVSSTEIATAAVEFWRQGLSEQEVNARLQATTRYAKISSMEFKQAAEVMTAATNSFQDFDISANRVADVFSYLGDASAAGADEIGIAMQRASASAATFGVTFEWLGAYIATVSERTRLAPEVIGTAMNSILARLYQIRETGFNDEDATNINMVSKALAEVNIAMSESDGTWRSFSDIVLDLSGKWDTLSDKQRSYIATTMAGTRQQNFFLNLMTDMAKGAEGGSRAFELYEGAINSAGQSAEKYAIYQESMAAAQDKLKLEMENMYSLLSKDLFKGWYEGAGDFVRTITDGTTASKGLNVILPLVAAGVVGLSVAMAGAASTAGIATASFAAFSAVLQAHPIMLAIGAFALLFTVVSKISASLNQQTIPIQEGLDTMRKQLDDITISQEEWTGRVNKIEDLRAEYIKLTSEASLTAEQEERLKKVMDEIAKLSPDLQRAIESETGQYGDQTAVIRGLNDELERQLKLKGADVRSQVKESYENQEETNKSIREEEDRLNRQRKVLDDYRTWYEANLRIGNDFGTPQQWAEQYAKENIVHLRKGGNFGNAYNNTDVAKWLNEVFEGLGADRPGRLSLENNAKDLAPILAKAFRDADDEQIKLDSQKAEAQATSDRMAEEFFKSSYAYLTASSTIQRMMDEAYAIEMAKPENKLGQYATKADYESRDARLTNLANEFSQMDSRYKMDIGAQAKIAQIDNAYAAAQRDKTQESLDSYNKLVDEWNSEFGETYRKMNHLLAETILPSAEELAKEAGKTGDDVATAQETQEEYLRKRRAAKDAARTGFRREVEDIGFALEGADGKWDASAPVRLTKYMNSLREANEHLYNDIMDKYPSIGKMMDGAFSGEELKAQWQAIQEEVENTGRRVIEVADETKKYVTQNTEGMDEAQLISSLINALSGGGKQAMFDQLEAFSPEQREIVASMVPLLQGLTEETANYELTMAALREQLDGTFEGITADITAFLEASKDSPEAMERQAAAVQSMIVALSNGEGGVAEFNKAWDALQIGQREKFSDISPIFKQIREGTVSAQEGVAELERILSKINTQRMVKLGKVWKEVGDVIDDVGKNTNDFQKSQMQFNKRLDDGIDAVRAYNYVVKATDKTTEEYKSALSTLTSYTGIAGDSAHDLSIAQQFLSSDMENATLSATWLLNTLMSVAGITFSAGNWQAELAALAGSSNATEQAVYNLAKRLLSIDGTTLSIKDGKVSVTGLGGGSLMPVAPSGGGRRSGGGGGGSKKQDEQAKEITEVSEALKKYLDALEEASEFVDFQRELIDLTRSYHEMRGELTAVITLTEQEIGVVKALSIENAKVEKDLRSRIEAKQAELRTYALTSKEYQQAYIDLKALQEQHKEYSQKLIKNKSDLESLNQAIKENRDAIRTQEIELRDLLKQAFEDRDELQQSMRNARIKMEDEILSAIKSRYQKEWDLIKEDVDKKKKAYNEELKLIREKLAERKKQTEEADKYEQLRSLEEQLSMVAVDPTRAKDQQELMKKIASLREELAWRAADKEVELQEKSIQQQIESLDKYLEYINQYYEDMFENPQALVVEMNNILRDANEEMRQWLTDNYIGFSDLTQAEQEAAIASMYQMAQIGGAHFVDWASEHIRGFSTLNESEQASLLSTIQTMTKTADDTVIAWLQTNNTEFANSTAAKQQEMTRGWEDNLREMYGSTTTYWGAIEDIIKGGDQSIIDFLKDNLNEYRTAGDLQSAAYVDEWMTRLEALKSAYRDTLRVITEANIWEPPTPPTPTTSPSTGGSSSSSGGKKPSTKEPSSYWVVINGQRGSGPFKTGAEAQASIDKWVEHYTKAQQNAGNTMYGLRWHTETDAYKNAQREYDLAKDALAKYKTATVKAYLEGGLVDYTGTAIVHGSPSRPEAFLKADDTALMRTFLDAALALAKPSMPAYQFDSSRGGNPVSIDSITINVEKLDGDKDYEEMAEQVAIRLQRRLTVKSGAPVVGGRFG